MRPSGVGFVEEAAGAEVTEHAALDPIPLVAGDGSFAPQLPRISVALPRIGPPRGLALGTAPQLRNLPHGSSLPWRGHAARHSLPFWVFGLMDFLFLLLRGTDMRGSEHAAEQRHEPCFGSQVRGKTWRGAG